MPDARVAGGEARESDASLFDDWADRYQFLIDLGKNCPMARPKNEETRVKDARERLAGGHPIAGTDRWSSGGQRLRDRQGLVAIPMARLFGQPAQKIVSFDVEKLLADLVGPH